MRLITNLDFSATGTLSGEAPVASGGGGWDPHRTRKPLTGVKLRSKPFEEKVEQEIVAVARQMLAENDDIGAILLECTELSPAAVAVQNAVRLPVWDYTTLTKWIYSGCIRRPFTGHI